MPTLTLKPAHKVVSAYYDNLAKFEKLGIKHETAVRSAFQELLEHCARQFDWKLIPEYRLKAKGGNQISVDGALLDNYGLNHGLWEAKDSADDLDKEIKNKFSVGYPKLNILFWQPDRAVLYQNGEKFYEADLTKPEDLVHILSLFLEFAPPAIAEWEKAVEEFRDKVPQIGASLKKLIETERQTNKKFIAAFEDFCSLCRGSLNPNISIEAVEEMIIQHILGGSGIVCFVNNNSFVTEKTFDGMRKELAKDFDEIYVLDLGGNVRKNPKLSGTTHNVFGIQVGVSINLFVRHGQTSYTKKRQSAIYYHAVGQDWRKEQKYEFLEKKISVDGMKWKKLSPDDKGNWITNDTDEEFNAFIPIGSKEAKAGTPVPTIFRTYSLGVSTNRDGVVYDFDKKRLAERVQQFADDYNAELHRWQKKGKPDDVDNFVNYEKLKWSRNLKRWFSQEVEMEPDNSAIRKCLYRPFTPMQLFFQRMIVDEVGTSGSFFTESKAQRNKGKNYLLCTPGAGGFRPFHVLATTDLVSMDFIDKTQCFPLFTYSEDGKHNRENVTPQARIRFQNFYSDDKIKERDIFHYVYALLHHPAYRTRYAENLKRDLPRIPFAGKDGFLPSLDEKVPQRTAAQTKADAEIFWAFVKAGEKLADLHVNYESAKEFKLKRIENKEVKLDWRVEAMKLTKDKSAIVYNDFLTLEGIPPEVFDYKLGNRSALEWVIDQYRVTRDAQGNIASDPNRMDDEEYIVGLIGKVVTVSLKTLEAIAELPPITPAG